METINLGRVAFVYKGDYSAVTTYNKMDVVFDGESSFVSQIDNNVGNALVNGLKWKYLSRGNNLELQEAKQDIVALETNLNLKIDKTSVKQVTGESIVDVMSQKAVTDELEQLADDVQKATSFRTVDDLEDNIVRLVQKIEVSDIGELDFYLAEVINLDDVVYEGFTLGQIFSNNIISNIPCYGAGNTANVLNNNGIWSAQKGTISTTYCYFRQAVSTPSRLFARIVHRCSAPNYTFRFGTAPTLVNQKAFTPNVWNKSTYIGNVDTTGTGTRYEFLELGTEQQTIEIDLNNSIVVDTSMFSVQPTVEQMDNWYMKYKNAI